ncbi:hypothetical protein LTR16_000635 [Cryomyces antarcticus]|uniref:DUF8035 domain-containing protein n=1 Tax=Cryomyces antarcticus TaxID=329879 RepID=A0ABR0LZV0_9PEZI|nr:hypothetical protein LTR39_000413 [Cryomyces antarcticus]KAK5020743.1 hypothetical protein LTR60_000265 [Cryomyces antarcticus]KAK5164995.1 hypothetical protein LTR04_001605 [Oleoguttula sp. CCFEE 6159]KAK5257445.1 hypothetical protein LTR16_000635 [Cryomyces antarcticus]
MSRRYPTADLYEERERDFYARPRTERDYDELDIDISRTRAPARVYSPPPQDNRRGAVPKFLREDYGRTDAGALVVRERVTEDFDRPPSRPKPREREVEREEVIIRDREVREPERRRERPRERDVEREEIIIRRGEREPERPRPRDVEREEVDIQIRRSEREREPERRRAPPPREREVEREEIVLRRGEVERRPPPREREVEKEEIIFRRGEREPERPRPREVEREEVDIQIRRGEREERPAAREVDRELVIRRREPSLPPPIIAREREEYVYRRRKPETPPPREVEKEEIIIRRRERSPPAAPSPVREPSPPPPEPIRKPPVIQEIITHHRHIDHGKSCWEECIAIHAEQMLIHCPGVERARSPSPISKPPSPKQDESLEIEIRRRGTRNGQKFYDEDIIYERDIVERRTRDRDVELTRRRSLSAPRRRQTRDDIEDEAEYYARKAAERAYIGEAYNGATKDWAIVDVPPGTNRVQMDGAGGGSQEVTWQRYNGVRRSKFRAGDEVWASDYSGGRTKEVGRLKTRSDDMWTEITKDLVVREAIEQLGYSCEETEYFFYVIEYLRYEDVLELVELSEEIRRDRRERIREIQWEREELERRPERRPIYDERIYEREVIYDGRRPGRYR